MGDFQWRQGGEGPGVHVMGAVHGFRASELPLAVCAGEVAVVGG